MVFGLRGYMAVEQNQETFVDLSGTSLATWALGFDPSPCGPPSAVGVTVPSTLKPLVPVSSLPVSFGSLHAGEDLRKK